MKRTLSIILSIIMIVTMLPTFAVTALAYDKAITNIHWGTGGDDKYIYWDPVDGAVEYDVSCGTGGGTTEETSYNCAHTISHTGDYTVKIYAIDKDGYQITDVAFSTPKHFEITPLPTPTNIQVDDETVSWDPVPNTRYYILGLCRYDESDPFNKTYQTIRNVFIFSGNSYALGDFYELENGKEYYFGVKAFPDNYDYGESEYGFSAVFTHEVPVLATITNLAWGTGDNEKVLTWDPVPDATEYRYTCGTGGGTVYTNSLDCTKHIKQTGDYTATIVAYKDDKIISTEATSTSKHFELIDLSSPTNIQIVGDTITWDAVEHASKYYVKICPFRSDYPYRPTFDTNVYNVYTTSTSVDFAPIKALLTNGNDYYIAVKAMDETYNYGEGQYGVSDKFTYYRTFTVTTSVDGENGTISAGDTVNMGSNYTVTVTPNKTYNLAYLKVNGVDVTNSVVDGQYTINDISADTTVVASFSECEHDWGTGAETKAATCGEKGIRTYTCSKCSKTKTEEIAKLTTHTWDDGTITTFPDCKNTGVRTFTCTVCTTTKTETVGKTDTHSYGDYSTTTPATCTNTGIETRTCSICKKKDERAIDPIAHDYNDATCTEPRKCKNCPATDGSPLGHSYTDYKSNNDATCTKNCTETASCDNGCGETDTQEIDNSKLPHSYTSAITAPATCTAVGTRTYTCTACSDAYTEKIDALGHSFGDNQQTCSVCGVANPDYKAPQTTQADTEQSTAPAVETIKFGAETLSPNAQGEYVSKKAKKPALSKVTAGKKSFTANWKAIKGVAGYQVQYATDSKFKKNKKSVTVKKAKTVKTTVKKLSAKKKYYVRIRTYTTVNGKKVYSDWSKVKTVTTKK